MPQLGEVIADTYRLDALVGSGGMGVVYAATHVTEGSRFAVKFLRREGETGDTARFAREAEAASRLKSEHVARVFDAGATADGASYLVMELLEGATLDRVVAGEGPLSVERASACVMQACRALTEAHGLGIVHRDIKPSNLFLLRTGRMKVIDFGIARVPFSVESATRTGAFMGSPPFMSPEQIHAEKDIDARTDVWSLGVVLYFLVTGTLPFDARSPLDLMTLIAYEEPPSLREKRPDVPEAFEKVILRCLAKERAGRFSSVVELAEALAPFAPAEPFAMTSSDVATVDDAFAHSVGASTTRRRSRWMPMTLGIGGAIVLASGGWAWQHARVRPSAAAPAADLVVPVAPEASSAPPAPSVSSSPPIPASAAAVPAAPKQRGKVAPSKPTRAAPRDTSKVAGSDRPSLPTTPD